LLLTGIEWKFKANTGSNIKERDNFCPLSSRKLFVGKICHNFFSVYGINSAEAEAFELHNLIKFD